MPHECRSQQHHGPKRAASNNFGDISVVSGGHKDGDLYGTTTNTNNTNGRPFKLNLAGLAKDPTLGAKALNKGYKQLNGHLGMGSLETAFNSSFTTLFANKAQGLQPGQTGPGRPLTPVTDTSPLFPPPS